MGKFIKKNMVKFIFKKLGKKPWKVCKKNMGKFVKKPGKVFTKTWEICTKKT